MTPSQALADESVLLLAADTGSLASSSALKVHLVTNDINPDRDAVIGDFTKATGNGLDPLLVGTGTQPTAKDPITGEWIIDLKDPAGGFRWETSGGFTGPLRIYGYLLAKNDGSGWWGFERETRVITLTADNQVVDAPNLEFRVDVTQIH